MTDRENMKQLKKRWNDINQKFGWTLGVSQTAVSLYDANPLPLDDLGETAAFEEMHLKFVAETGRVCSRRTLLDHLYDLRKAARTDRDTGKKYRILPLKRGGNSQE